MEIKVIEVKEKKDGSAIVTIELDRDAQNELIEAGFVSILAMHLGGGHYGLQGRKKK